MAHAPSTALLRSAVPFPAIAGQEAIHTRGGRSANFFRPDEAAGQIVIICRCPQALDCLIHAGFGCPRILLVVRLSGLLGDILQGDILLGQPHEGP